MVTVMCAPCACVCVCTAYLYGQNMECDARHRKTRTRRIQRMIKTIAIRNPSCSEVMFRLSQNGTHDNGISISSNASNVSDDNANIAYYFDLIHCTGGLKMHILCFCELAFL